ncbi:hypothetical protein EDC94DRAFT_614516 [Helicostylum pulchrum]|nr:hypothetical protein EDC94DRAFT_614516 [Helicostylum pulchrum]
MFFLLVLMVVISGYKAVLKHFLVVISLFLHMIYLVPPLCLWKPILVASILSSPLISRALMVLASTLSVLVI